MTIQAGRSVKLVYQFGEGNASMGDLLGGKGSNLCEMVRLGLPGPPTTPTAASSKSIQK